MLRSEAMRNSKNAGNAASPKDDMRRYSRAQLLEVIMLQSMENDELKDEVARLNLMLSEKNLVVDKAGSIADASLSLNSVFRDAELAAEQYKANVMRLSTETKAVGDLILVEAVKKAALKVYEAEERADALMAAGRAEADKYWNDVAIRLQRLRGAGGAAEAK